MGEGAFASLLVQLLLRSASKLDQAVMLDQVAQSLVQSSSEYLQEQRSPTSPAPDVAVNHLNL